ncbi:unnamed protein product [Amoebophrya sp. A120]|nr:unnamed protein product [Amoebophrya sp. A120]|eukprot:GSA120T00013698001.1
MQGRLVMLFLQESYTYTVFFLHKRYRRKEKTVFASQTLAIAALLR